MNIGINTLFIVPNKVGGTEYHTRSFLKYLEKNDDKNNYIIFCNKENFNSFNFKSNKWKKVLCNVGAKNKISRILYEQFILPFLVLKNNIQVFHSFGYFGPIIIPKVKKVLTIHDTNWLDHPGDNSFITNITLRFLMKWSIRTSSLVTTSSIFSRKRILHYFPYTKIKIIYPGIDNVFKQIINKETKSIYFDYALCVSAFYPHKKISYLIKLWSKIKNNKLKLIIVGHSGKEQNNIKKLSKKNKDILVLDKVSLKELANLYKFSKLFLFPSIYEGFGFPVYEALYANKITVVGIKEIYDPSIQDELEVFTFDIKKDLKLIKRLLKKNDKAKFEYKNSYDSSSKELISAYQSLTS